MILSTAWLIVVLGALVAAGSAAYGQEPPNTEITSFSVHGVNETQNTLTITLSSSTANRNAEFTGDVLQYRANNTINNGDVSRFFEAYYRDEFLRVYAVNSLYAEIERITIVSYSYQSLANDLLNRIAAITGFHQADYERITNGTLTICSVPECRDYHR